MSKKRGPQPRPKCELRTNRISVRFNDAEFEALQNRAGSKVAKRLAAYLRESALDKLPPQIPELNRNSWLELSRSAANLNQISRAINSGESLGLDIIKSELAAFRAALLGVNFSEEGENNEG